MVLPIVKLRVLLTNCGLSEYWLSQSLPIKCYCIKSQCLCDHSKQTRITTVNDAAIRIFKTVHNFERYMLTGHMIIERYVII